MTINNILALKPTWGGYLNSNKKNYSERRNHGLSLANLTHCISPSEYCNDYYNNDSFNKINLQLHASSVVSNPYTFNILESKNFSGNCAIIGEKYIVNASKYFDKPNDYDIYGYSKFVNLGSITPSTFEGFQINAIADNYSKNKAMLTLNGDSKKDIGLSIILQINNTRIDMIYDRYYTNSNSSIYESSYNKYIFDGLTDEDFSDKIFTITLKLID